MTRIENIMFFWTRLLVFLIAVITVIECNAVEDSRGNPFITQDVKRYQVKGEFSEIKDFLILAITERGIKISSTSYISKMLKRTREDVGGGKNIYKNAEAIGFCSATLSRQMMESDPHHIVFCPYTIVIYELNEQPGTIYLSFRRPFYTDTSTTDKSLQKIDELLSGIITEIVE